MAAESGAGAAGQPVRSGAVAAAQARLACGDPAGCLSLLAALPAAQQGETCVRQLQAVCQVQLAGASDSQRWWEVFGLDPARATAANVRRQYKRLAALVHPDKCGLAAAGPAFQALQAAADGLLQQLQTDEAGGERRKRARTQPGGADAEEGLWGGGADAEDDGWFRDGGGFPWWEAWDPPTPAEPSPTAQQSPGGPVAAAGERRQGGAAATAAQQEQQAPGSPGSEARGQLLRMALPELRAEVRRRQAALLEPQLDAEGRAVPLSQLQAALRQARRLLADRVAAEAAEGAAALGGGFLP